MKLLVNVKSTIPDLRKLAGYYKSTAKRPLDDSGNYMVKAIKNRIKRGVRPALRPATIEKKRRGWSPYKGKMPYPSRALYALGLMYRAIHFFKSGPLTGFIGIRKIGSPERSLLAWWHQFTVSRPRRFFFVSNKDKSYIKAIWERWFFKGPIYK